MSILIKGMEIPKDYKYVDVRIFRDGTATTSTAEKPFYKRMDVIEVPTPHGDLIDGMALLESIKEARKKDPEIEDVYIDDYFTVAEWVVSAPAIIEAEVKHE